MFDSDSSVDEQPSKAQKRQIESQEKAHEILGSLAFVATATAEPPPSAPTPAATAIATAVVSAPPEAVGEMEAVSLRDAYTLPKPGRKKKKKALNAGQAGGVKRTAAAAGLGFEAEAEQFRSALSGAYAGVGASVAATPPPFVASTGTPAPGQEGTLVPRLLKKKKKKIVRAQPAAGLDTAPVAHDPYAIDDPYSFVGAPSDEAIGEAATVAEGGMPKKKKKKIVRRAVQAAPAATATSAGGGPFDGVDPYS
jgi:hypothetical protein